MGEPHWIWRQTSGQLLDASGQLVSTGYSGKGRGRNNPALQGVQGIGPIPQGMWRLVRLYDSDNVGPATIALDAVDAKPGDDRHEPTGRSAFRIHGDSIRAPGTASRGCIILPRADRLKLWRSNIRLLKVEP